MFALVLQNAHVLFCSVDANSTCLGRGTKTRRYPGEDSVFFEG